MMISDDDANDTILCQKFFANWLEFIMVIVSQIICGHYWVCHRFRCVYNSWWEFVGLKVNSQHFKLWISHCRYNNNRWNSAKHWTCLTYICCFDTIWTFSIESQSATLQMFLLYKRDFNRLSLCVFFDEMTTCLFVIQFSYRLVRSVEVKFEISPRYSENTKKNCS